MFLGEGSKTGTPALEPGRLHDLGALQEWHSLSWKCSSWAGEPLVVQVRGEIQPHQSTRFWFSSITCQFLRFSGCRFETSLGPGSEFCCAGYQSQSRPGISQKVPQKIFWGHLEPSALNTCATFPPWIQHRVFRLCCLSQS